MGENNIAEPEISLNTQKINNTSVHEEVRGALLLQRIHSLEDLQQLLQFNYSLTKKPKVEIIHESGGKTVVCTLKDGMRETDLERAYKGGFWTKVGVAIKSPYAAFHARELRQVATLARRKPVIFGEGDVAFYDLSEIILQNIHEYDKASMDEQDLSEKGYFNSFNHITAQAFITSLFSEKLADFIADMHELKQLPELATGSFSEDQIADLENGAVDNYIDLINNEWGQELGKKLKEKHNINSNTKWTPILLSAYLNDVQAYFSRAFQIGFNPVKVKDEKIIRFSNKLNLVINGKTL